jgi:hypothetical protein
MRVLTWKEAEAGVEWGGRDDDRRRLSLGLAVFDTGAARWLAWVLLGQITAVPDLLRPFVIVLAVAGLHLLFSSNTSHCQHHHPDSRRACDRPSAGPLDDRRAGGVHLVAGVRARERGAYDHHSVRVGLLLDP